MQKDSIEGLLVHDSESREFSFNLVQCLFDVFRYAFLVYLDGVGLISP